MRAPHIRVLIADDHPLIQRGLMATIDAEPDMRVVAAASDGAEAIAFFRTHRPDISVIDLRMPRSPQFRERDTRCAY